MNPAACTLDVVVAVQAAVMAKGRSMTSMTSAITATGLHKPFGGMAAGAGAGAIGRADGEDTGSEGAFR